PDRMSRCALPAGRTLDSLCRRSRARTRRSPSWRRHRSTMGVYRSVGSSVRQKRKLRRSQAEKRIADEYISWIAIRSPPLTIIKTGGASEVRKRPFGYIVLSFRLLARVSAAALDLVHHLGEVVTGGRLHWRKRLECFEPIQPQLLADGQHVPVV